MQTSVGVKLAKRYQLQELRGEGTYGKLWKAWDEQVMRPVAVKVLKAGKEALEELRKEGIAAGGLSHKNIVQVYDFDPNDGFLVSEYVEGKSLEELLITKRKEGAWVTEKEAMDILKQCLEALEHAHERGRIHGDVKPANILIRDRTGEVKLTDFGVAKILSAEKFRDPSALQGSTTYAAPEVLRGDRSAPDFQSDLFSLGMIAYLLLTKKHPFVDETGLQSIPEMIESDDYKPPDPTSFNKEISKNLAQVVSGLLNKDKLGRFRNARKALDSLLSEEIGQFPCSECGKNNAPTAKFCSECGKQLLKEVAPGQPPYEDVLTEANDLFVQGLVYDAITRLENGLKSRPKFAAGWAELGYMYNNIRKYDSAEEACTKAIQIEPNLAPAFQTRGFARSNLGRYSEAVSDFNDALRKTVDPRRKAQILYHRAHSQMLAGNLEKACEDVREALRFNPYHESAKWLQGVVCR